MASTLPYTEHEYGHERELQKVGVWAVDVDVSAGRAPKCWIIYVHGGAWRDPSITKESFEPTVDRMVVASASLGAIAAFASIDYRLSADATRPQDGERTPRAAVRDARDPDHVRDVGAAIGWLQGRYGFGENYVLVGHSVGATMAFQLLMGRGGRGPPDPVPAPGPILPRAIVGLEGIYDFDGLVGRFGPGYGAIFTGAGYVDTASWHEASPMKFRASYRSSWLAGQLAVLAWSCEDELVDVKESEGMAAKLGRDGVETLLLTDLQGTHDGMWRDGQPLADVIWRTLRELGI